GAELCRDRSWVYAFSAAELEEIQAAVGAARRLGRSLEAIGREDFPLPTLGPVLAGPLLEEMRSGRGFIVLRGLPVDRLSDEDSALAYWGIGRHLGEPVKQNVAG